MILDVVAGAALVLLVGTWLVYPAIIWMLSRVLMRSSGGVVPSPASVSVVIASRDDAAAIRARVANCLDTVYGGDLEVVIALDRGTAAADEELSTMDDRVRIVSARGRGKAAALNEGVAASTGAAIVFADTWQRFEPETIPALLAELRDARVGAVSGSLQIPSGRASLTRTYWTYERWLRRCEARVHSTVGATGAVYALRRELWTPLPEGVLLDDVFTPMRVVLRGRRVAFADDARAIETRVSAPRQEYRRKVRTLTGVLQVCSWLPVTLHPVRNPIWAQFVTHKLARLTTPYALIAVMTWIMVQGAALLLPVAIPLTGVVVAGGLWAGFGRGTAAARVRDLLVEGTLLQLAIVTAGINGIRGRWEVWSA